MKFLPNIVSCRVGIFILSLTFLGVLASCDTQTSQFTSPSAQEQKTPEVARLDFLDQIPVRFVENENFQMCVKQNIDMCMQEASYSSETGEQTEIVCAEFLSEDNRFACEFTKATSEAKKQNDTTLCETLTGDAVMRCQSEVLMSQAMETGDTSICESLPDFEQISCNNRIVMNQAVTKKDTKICDKLLAYEGDSENFEKEMCVQEVGLMLEMDAEQARMEAEMNTLGNEKEVQ